MGSLDKPPKIGKSGAQRIGAILDAPDSELNAQIARAGKGFFASDSNAEARPSRGTVSALRSTRAQYRDMRDRIAKIETSRKDAKKDVLDALDRYVAALGAFSRALPSHATDSGVEAMSSAARKAKSAASDLEKARKKLK